MSAPVSSSTRARPDAAASHQPAVSAIVETIPVSIQPVEFSEAQRQLLGWVQDCLANRAQNKRVILIDPTAIKTASAYPYHDMRKVLTHMLHGEKSIVAIASYGSDQFLVMATSDACIESHLDAGRTSDWISDANPEDSTELLQSVADRLRKERLGQLLDREPIPHEEVLTLLIQVAILPQSLTPERSRALLQILSLADAHWFQQRWPDMQPAVVKSLVEMVLLHPHRIELWEKMVGVLTALPNHHRILLAFAGAFPLAENLPPPSGRYQEVKNAVGQAPAIEIQRGQGCLAFARTSAFILFFNHLPDAMRRQLLRQLFAYVGRYTPVQSTDQWKEVLELAGRFDATYGRIILEALSFTLEAEAIGQICVHPHADASLVDAILARHPSEVDGAYGDSFFYTLLLSLLKAAAPSDQDRVMRWIMQSVFSKEDQQRQESLLLILTQCYVPLLARIFAQYPHLAPIRSETLLQMVASLPQNSAEEAASIPAITSALKAEPSLPRKSAVHEQTIERLFCLEDEDLKVKILLDLLSIFRTDTVENAGMALSLLLKLPTASSSVWQRVGQSWHLPDYFTGVPNQEIDRIFRSLPPESLVGLINGLAARPNVVREANAHAVIGAVYQFLFLSGPVEGRLLTPLSDAAVQYFPSDAAMRGREGEEPTRENRLVSSFIKSLEPSEENSVRRVLVCLTKKLFRGFEQFINAKQICDCLETLSSGQLHTLPREDYPRGMAFFFALFSNRFDTQGAVLRTLEPRLQEKERLAIWDVLQAMHDLERIKAIGDWTYLIPLIQCLNQSQGTSCLLLEEIVDRYVSKTVDVQKLLLLPAPLLIGSLKRLSDRNFSLFMTKLNSVLPRLNLADRRHALEECWNTLLRNGGLLINNGFPFKEALDCLEDPGQIALLVMIPIQAMTPLNLLNEPHRLSVRAVLDALERAPWKFWVSLNKSAVNAQALREGLIGEENYVPHCIAILNWYYNPLAPAARRDEMGTLSNQMNSAIQEKRWPDAWALWNRLDDNTKAFFLSEIRGPSAQWLAKNYPFSSFGRFGAIFDPECREKIIQTILTGQVDEYFLQWAELCEELLAPASTLPLEAQTLVRSFIDQVGERAGIGGARLPLRGEYNNPQFSDVLVCIGQERIHAHTALLALNPFFKQFQLLPDRLIVVPAELQPAALHHLKFLYGVQSLTDLVRQEGQECLQQRATRTAPFAALYQNPLIETDCILKVEDREIKVHRFLVARVFKTLGDMLQPLMMAQTPKGEIEIRDHRYEIIEAAIRFLYTEAKPQFVTPAEVQEYQRAIDFLTAGEPSPLFR